MLTETETTTVSDHTNSDRRLNKDTKMKMDNFIDANPVYRFVHFIQSRHLYESYQHKSFLRFQVIARFFAFLLKRKGWPILKKTWQELYPKEILAHHSPNKWAYNLVSHVIEILFEVTFYIPHHTEQLINHFVTPYGYSHIENALQQKKGVLMPSVHMGEMFHILSFLARQYITIDGKRQKVGVVVIASPENEFFFQELLKRYDNVFVPVTGPFNELSQVIEEHLRQNRCVMMMHDYFKKHQYRVPFVYGSKSYDFLIPVPRLLTVLHLKLGSPIIPSLSFLRKNLKYSKVVFFKPIDPHKVHFKTIPPALHKDLEEYKAGTLEKAKKHALLSLLINRRLYPFVLKYPFLWQEAYLFHKRSAFRIKLDNIRSYYEFYSIIVERLHVLIKKSYEPGRPDALILEKLHQIQIAIQPLQVDPHMGIQMDIDNVFIELGRLTSRRVFKKIVSIVKSKQNQYVSATYPEISILFADLVQLF
ncbi:MAG: hypothetical protein ACTSVZ_06615 [Promethearchaeota archaeon]